MSTSPQQEVSGAYNLVFRYTLAGQTLQMPGLVLVNSDGAEVTFGSGLGAVALADNADAQAASGTANGQKVVARQTVFNGTTWDRQRGDTAGTDSVLAPRATAGGVPANGVAAYHIGQGLAGFSAGIAIAATGAIGDTDTTALAANDLIIQVDYA